MHAKDEMVCDKCDKTIFKHNKARHLKSLKCRLAYLEKSQV